jgi:uncharacterized protein YbcI
MSVGRGGVIGPPAWVTATRWAAGEGWSVTRASRPSSSQRSSSRRTGPSPASTTRREPERAQARSASIRIRTPDLITVVLQELLTKGERSLVRDGKADFVLEMRRAYQFTMREDFTAGIEEITGRRVIAFLSANHIDPDLAIESFMLAPQNNGHQPHAPDTRG